MEESMHVVVNDDADKELSEESSKDKHKDAPRENQEELGVGKIGLRLGLDQSDRVLGWSGWIKIHPNSTRTYNSIRIKFGSDWVKKLGGVQIGSDSGYIGFRLDSGYLSQFRSIQVG